MVRNMSKNEMLVDTNEGYCVVHGIPTMRVSLPSEIVIKKHIDGSSCSYLDSWDPNVGNHYFSDRAALLDLSTVSLEELYVLVSDPVKMRGYIMAPFPDSLINIERIFGYLAKRRMVLPFRKRDPVMDEVSALSLYSMIYRGLVPPLIRNYITNINLKYVRGPDRKYFEGMTMNDLKLFTGESSQGSARMMLGFLLVTDSDYGAFKVLPKASEYAWNNAYLGLKEDLRAVGVSILSRIRKSSSDFLINNRSDVATLVHYLESQKMSDVAEGLRVAWKEKFRSDLQ